jgi:hypothetical protein
MTAVFFLLSLSVFTPWAVAADEKLPTKDNPLIIDKEGKRVLIYTEVNGKKLQETNPHWGVVFKDGKYGDKAILRAYANHLAFHDALVEIGAKPGNNLAKDVLDVPVEGAVLEMTATWPGLGKELKPGDIFYDKNGKGFEIRFGGNRKASEENNTGCITCLESCWISIASNAKYPNISGAKRQETPNSLFKGKEDVLPGDGKPVILIYRLVSA